ncbi:1-(5-phosphoribosyl)-5-[(5-phosphoribosylamino)methylideneamino] imidazole-4-carboxamide isomerase [Limimonas halophila]|uniref:1-(5-phosphoribosyl)-5-[(5-phosphoribosylamino)methylideneamino] imidazole-4-carboxamide isomerase n=1 Tax=Limimonas halophila TaxID=1082479 RepID=A0A1G7RC94_9PROT|nr:1-(5-phosphoribosyl)-5-[(5-phosphoribosylamino)methylideneamino]imidazole-4-carboxamide isomerase [Limimonas halophila]SDG08265.1 1-(5-phosphoribosyl)-5-[(5-phosphoribosylamino)methylideneamino] imidazole-4-carboxamide isomerase [Limimonas halophila]
MILYPAIDLKGGRAVRLLRGDMAAATVYNDDPVAQARAFQDAGFEWLHVVDLDGAFAGHPANAEAVQRIVEEVRLPVQLGGGIRDHATIGRWLDAGVERVILGTAAVKDPELVYAACREHPGRIVVGIDARDGYVATEGWAEVSTLTTQDLARRFERAGVTAIVHTDVGRDGALTGVNVAATAELARAIDTPVIASGGVAGLDDLRRLRAVEDAGIEGVIVGRALYDGRIEPREALALLAGETA